MTAKELFNTALEMAGLNGENLFETTDISEKMISIVNTVYSDIYFLNHKSGFMPITSSEDSLALNENELYDCAVYGVAAYIQNIMGTTEDYGVFKSIYTCKQKKLKSKCEIKSISDTFLKGE